MRHIIVDQDLRIRTEVVGLHRKLILTCSSPFLHGTRDLCN